MKRGIAVFEAMNDLPASVLLRAALPEDGESKPREARASLWDRINTNAWVAAAIGLVVALGVVTLIVLAGRGAGGPGIAGTSAPGTEAESVLITVPEAETETAPVTELLSELLFEPDTAEPTETEAEAETEAPLTFAFDVQDTYLEHIASKYLKGSNWEFTAVVKTTCLSGQYEADLIYTPSHTSRVGTNTFMINPEDDNSNDNGPGARVDLILPNGNVIRMDTSWDPIMGPEGDWTAPPDYFYAAYRAGESVTHTWQCTFTDDGSGTTENVYGWDYTSEGPYTLRIYLMGQEMIVEDVYFPLESLE